MKVTILNTELEADLLNPRVAKLYEEGFQEAVQEMMNAKACSSGAEGLRQQCGAVTGFFQKLFGAEQLEEVFGKETNLLVCLEVMESMRTIYERQVLPLLQERADRLFGSGSDE